MGFLYVKHLFRNVDNSLFSLFVVKGLSAARHEAIILCLIGQLDIV